jgi:hypothetical protein
MQSLYLIDSIVEVLELLGRKIETLNSLNLTDLSVRSEEFFRGILNRVLNLDLKNINIDEPSALAIDLGDVEGQLAIQVTANGTARKVKDTVSKFVERGLASKYRRLVILQIAIEGGRNIRDICDPKIFKFDPKKDIWGKKDLAREISGLSVETLKSLRDYMKSEVPSLFGQSGSASASSALRVSARYIGGKNGTSASLTIFNSDTHTRYLSSWFVEWGDKSAECSLKCESGSLPYRLNGQDKYAIVVNLDRRRLKEIFALGIHDGDNNRFLVPDGQIEVLKREAERRARLYPETDNDDGEDLSNCKVDVEAKVESVKGSKRSLLFTVTNKSEIAIPIVVGRLEWQYAPPRNMKPENDADTRIRTVHQVGGSLSLDCLDDLSAPVSPGDTIRFQVHESMARVLLETLLGDVPDENISFVFGTKSGKGWKAKEDGIPEAVRQFAEYIRNGGLDSDLPIAMDHESRIDSFAQEIPNIEFSDGTNVIEGTDYVYKLSRTTSWYVPRESESIRNWESRWERIREHFDRMAFVTRPIECTLLQVRVPGYHLNPLPEVVDFRKDLMGSGSGLSRESSQLWKRDGIPIFSEYPIRDAVGTPISNSAGEGFGWRFGIWRQYFKKGGPDWVSENREYPGPSLSELATECAQLLFGLPAFVAESLWRNWPEGFDRQGNCTEYLWLDALFELAWQGQPGDRLYAERFAPKSNGSIVLAGNGLFPRIPKTLEFVSSKVAHEHGFPVQVVSTLNNVVLTSIAAIDELLTRGHV